ncbi:hypothetical protein ACFOKI_01990 [Sphingomonas qilianensis]|uniref:Lipoprotein n=1 Tax=Sphingomonas qilianensis TaxID=1736690 RepID=A0ABU9XS03_9SPHN
MRFVNLMCLVPVLAIAACADTAPEVNDAQAEVAVDQAQQAADGNVLRGLPVSDDSVVVKPGQLPPMFEGRWGLTPADCDVARSDTKGLLVIRGSNLTFYTASADAKVIAGPSRYQVVADLTFTGKDAPAPRRDQLALTAANTVLQRTEPGGQSYRYERC